MAKSSLSTRALLVTVKNSLWTARKVDQLATTTANTAHKASPMAGKYHKKLLPSAIELENVNTIAGQIRKYFYEQTLPWMADGSRILSSQNYLIFAAEIRKMKASFDAAVADFEKAYPDLQKRAKSELGELYDETEYPLPEEIKERFGIEVTYFPLPDVKDFRTEVSDFEKKEFVKKMRVVESQAMRECWQKLHDVVHIAADKLSQPGAIFRDSLIENITEITKLLPRLNITEDKELERARKEVEKLVSSLSADTLRQNQNERDKAAKSLSDIEAKMGAFMGKTSQK